VIKDYYLLLVLLLEALLESFIEVEVEVGTMSCKWQFHIISKLHLGGRRNLQDHTILLNLPKNPGFSS